MSGLRNTDKGYSHFYQYELPKEEAGLNVVENCDTTCADMSEDAF